MSGYQISNTCTVLEIYRHFELNSLKKWHALPVNFNYRFRKTKLIVLGDVVWLRVLIYKKIE